MHVTRSLGANVVAFSMLLAVPAIAAAGAETPSGVTYAGKDSAGTVPGSVVPAASVPGAVSGASKDSAGVPSAAVVPSGAVPASVAATPARAGGLDPAATAMGFTGLGLVVMSGGLALRRRLQ